MNENIMLIDRICICGHYESSHHFGQVCTEVTMMDDELLVACKCRKFIERKR